MSSKKIKKGIQKISGTGEEFIRMRSIPSEKRGEEA